MLGAPVAFPRVTVPAGWTAELRGPRRWFVPPTPGGRIVVMPVQVLPEAGLNQLLEWVLVQEDNRRFKRSSATPLTARAGATGLWLDVAAIDAHGEAEEWRAYAAFELGPETAALLVLYAAPAAFEGLRPALLEVALSLTV